MANGANVERLKTRRKDIADAEALGEGDAVEGFMPVEQSDFESREDYRGYKMPPGMSLPQRRAYKKAIDERENFRSKAARQLPFVAGEAVESIKGFGRSAKEIGKGIGEVAVDAALTVPRAKAAMYTDPEGSKEFMGAVASGDREARKKLATKASESMIEPAATMGDAALAKYAAEEGKYGEAALYGGLVLAPFALQTLGKSMSKGWIKDATEAGREIPDDAAKKLEDLAKRVDEGKVTDDMQVRRELAQIEDDHFNEYWEEAHDKALADSYDWPPGFRGDDPVWLDEEYEIEALDDAARDVSQELNYLQSSTDEYGNPLINQERALELELENIEARKQEILSGRSKREASGGGTPGGGGGFKDQADQIIRELDELSFSSMQRSGLDMQPQSVLHKRLDDLRDRIEQAPPEVREEIFRRARMTSGGINPAPFTEALGQLRLADDIRPGNPLLPAYKPPGGGTPGGGGAARLREDNLNDRRQPTGMDLKRSPKFGIPDAGGDLVIRDLGPLTETDLEELEFVRKKYNLSESELKEYRDELGSRGYDIIVDQARDLPPDRMPRYGDSLPVGGRVPEFTEDTGIDQYKQLVMSFADEGRPFSFTEVFTDPSQPFDQDLYKAVDELVAEGRISGPSPFDDNVYDEFGRPLTHDTMVYTKTPSGGGESTGNVFLGQRQDSYTGTEKNLLDYLINNAGPEEADAIEYVENLFKQGKLTRDEAMREFDVIGKQIYFDDAVDPDAYPNFSRPQTMYDRAKSGGGRSIEDIEGPSEAEIQEMIERSRFGDPEELEMLKADMRRLADAEQRGQIARSNIRRTRTPGTPGEFSQPTEGTSRAERKGTARKRPKRKE